MINIDAGCYTMELHPEAGCDSAHVQQFEGGVATVRYDIGQFKIFECFDMFSTAKHFY